MRIALPSILILVLTGCYDFAGDLGRIGFDSNLRVDGVHHWTPDDPVANGAVATFTAVDVVDEDGERAPEVEGRSSGLEALWSEGRTVAVTGQNQRGRLIFDGEFHDTFRVGFRAPRQAELLDPLPAEMGLDATLPDTFGLLAGATRPVLVRLLDRRGQSLGYHPDDLAVVGGDAASAWPADEGFELVADAGGSSEISVGYGEDWFATSTVVVVAPEDIVALEVETVTAEVMGSQYLAAHATGYTAEGMPVLGIPVAWSWPDGLAPQVRGDALLIELGEGSDGVTVSAIWGDLEARVDP